MIYIYNIYMYTYTHTYIHIYLSVVIFGPAWDTDFGAQGNFDPLLPCPHFLCIFPVKIY